MNTKRSPHQRTPGGTARFEILAGIAILGLAMALMLVAGTHKAVASSHREAPLISQDPQADNTDVYAFVSPDMSDTVTILANYIPAEAPDAGPNFYAFGDNVLYEVKIDNTGDGQPDIIYQFRFNTVVGNQNTFLYATGPISSLDDPNWNVKQFYTVTRIEGNTSQVLGTGLKTPPDSIGPRTTPNYDNLAAAAVTSLGGRTFFAGQRDDPFFVDLGSIFDLGGLRPFNPYHLIPLSATVGLDGLHGLNVHTIALKVPITDLTRDHMRHPANDPAAVFGVWATASRQATHVVRTDGTTMDAGPWVQVSRLGNPLVNEVIIHRGQKDMWNAGRPSGEKKFLANYRAPELAVLENLLYGTGHPNGALQPISTTNRDDLVAILLTGFPGVNFTGNAKVDMLRLNSGIPPAATPDRLGVLANPSPDLAGYPNGRRPVDDIVDIDLRAFAQGYGAYLHANFGLPDLQPNDAVGDGVNNNDKPFPATFPYVASPWQGYDVGAPAPSSFAEMKEKQAEQVMNR